jgi:uncharacterized membrane protein
VAPPARPLLALALCLLGLPAAGPSEAAPGFVDLGTESVAAVSGNGLVAVGQHLGEAYRWQGGVTTLLGVLPGGDESAAFGVSADGSVVVGYSTFLIAGSPPFTPRVEGFEAVRWDGGVPTGLGIVPQCVTCCPCSHQIAGLAGANDVSDAADVIMGARLEGLNLTVVRWDPDPTALFVVLDSLTQDDPIPAWGTGVSADGDLAVGWVGQVGAPTEAAAWNALGTQTNLGFLRATPGAGPTASRPTPG